MTLCAVVVTFNRLAQLQITLPALRDQDVDHIIVVDNASTDDTPAWLADQANARVHVVQLADNTGGAGGFEAGMAYARDHFDPDWMVLMDDDSRPQSGALARFRAETPTLDSNFPNLGVVVSTIQSGSK
jgi:GT2 family glycosyltransferase